MFRLRDPVPVPGMSHQSSWDRPLGLEPPSYPLFLSLRWISKESPISPIPLPAHCLPPWGAPEFTPGSLLPGGGWPLDSCSFCPSAGYTAPLPAVSFLGVPGATGAPTAPHDCCLSPDPLPVDTLESGHLSCPVEGARRSPEGRHRMVVRCGHS